MGKTDKSDEDDDDDDELGEEDIECEKDVGKTVTLEMIKQWRAGLEVRYLTSICIGVKNASYLYTITK